MITGQTQVPAETETPTESRPKLTVDNCMQDPGFRALYPYMCAVARIAERLAREKAAREASESQALTS